MKDIDWKIISVLYETKNITKAAGVLYMTQSALSKRIRSIENEWGIEIVKRGSKGVIFTEEGRYLVKKANAMMNFLSEIEEHFHDNEMPSRKLRLGSPHSFTRLYLSEILQEYNEAYNQIPASVISNSSEIIVNWLVEEKIDMGIICGDFPYPGESRYLFSEELFVITPRETTIDELYKFPLISSYFNPITKVTIEQWWKYRFGVPPTIAQQVSYMDAAIEMVKRGLGISFLFGENWKPHCENLQFLPIWDKHGQRISRDIQLLLSEKCRENEDFLRFADFLENYSAKYRHE